MATSEISRIDQSAVLIAVTLFQISNLDVAITYARFWCDLVRRWTFVIGAWLVFFLIYLSNDHLLLKWSLLRRFIYYTKSRIWHATLPSVHNCKSSLTDFDSHHSISRWSAFLHLGFIPYSGVRSKIQTLSRLVEMIPINTQNFKNRNMGVATTPRFQFTFEIHLHWQASRIIICLAKMTSGQAVGKLPEFCDYYAIAQNTYPSCTFIRFIDVDKSQVELSLQYSWRLINTYLQLNGEEPGEFIPAEILVNSL